MINLIHTHLLRDAVITSYGPHEYHLKGQDGGVEDITDEHGVVQV